MSIAIRISTRTPHFAPAVEQLKALRLAGQLITAASADYDAARKVLNVTVDRRPLAIVRVANAQDTESLWQTIRPEGSGVYVNFLEREGADRVRDAYPPATLARLAQIKQKYDPQNSFRFNQNILPRASKEKLP